MNATHVQMDLRIIFLVLASGCCVITSSYKCQAEFQKQLTQCIEGYRLADEFFQEKDHHIILCKKSEELVRCIETMDRTPAVGCPLDEGQRRIMDRIISSTNANYGGDNCPYDESDYRRVRCTKRSWHSSQSCSLPERMRTSEDGEDFLGFCSRVRCYRYRMEQAGCDWDFKDFEHTVTKYQRVCGSSAVIPVFKLLMVMFTVLISL